MPSTTVRIGDEARQALRQLADKTGESMQVILDRAIKQYRRQLYLEEANAAYAALRNKPDAWQEELDERSLWDRTLTDNLAGDGGKPSSWSPRFPLWERISKKREDSPMLLALAVLLFVLWGIGFFFRIIGDVIHVLLVLAVVVLVLHFLGFQHRVT